MVEIVQTVVPALVTAILGWFLARRKYRSEVKSNELDNVEKAVEIWRKLSEDLENRLTKEIQVLREENGTLKVQVRDLTLENEKFSKELVSLRNFTMDLEKENELFLRQLRKGR